MPSQRENRALTPVFRRDVLEGLSRRRKALPPKYFYDARGSRLFEKICRVPEYYLTRAEMALTRRHLGHIARFAGTGAELVEFGSGEGLKTRLLLRALRPSAYVPVDISASAVEGAARRLRREFPDIEILPVVGDFSAAVALPTRTPRARRVVYFPGSTIGNLAPAEAIDFLSRSRRLASRLLVGADLRKRAATLEAAYNDARGVTAAFNLNLLERINRELGADFDLRRFAHHAFYDAKLGRVEMHLVSLAAQEVRIGRRRFAFRQGETIHTENSWKYSAAGFRALARRAGLAGKKLWLDGRRRFALHGLQGDGG